MIWAPPCLQNLSQYIALKPGKAMDHSFFYIMKGKSFFMLQIFFKNVPVSEIWQAEIYSPLFWAKWAKLNRYECVISTQLGQDDLQKRSLLADSVKHSVGKSSETDKRAFGRKSIYSWLQSIKNIEE